MYVHMYVYVPVIMEIDVADFMRRSATVINNIRNNHKVESWDEHYHRLHSSWACNIAQMRQYDPVQLMLSILSSLFLIFEGLGDRLDILC